jgi:hypothetical protein
MIMTARKSSLLRQFLWAATLAVGFGVLWFLLMLWLETWLQESGPGGRGNPAFWEGLVVRSDGTPLIRRFTYGAPAEVTFRDLSGGVQPTPEHDDLLPAITVMGTREAPSIFSRDMAWNQRLQTFLNEREPTVNWLFVHDGKANGAGYFVGYERTTNRRIGFIGLAGFRLQPLPPAEWVPVDGELIRIVSHWTSAPVWITSGRVSMPRLDRWDLPPRLVFVPSGNRLMLCDVAERTMTNIFESIDPIESSGVPSISSWSGGRPVKEQPILVRTKDRIHALDHKYSIITVFPIPAGVDLHSPVQWYELKSGESLVYFTEPSMVYRIGADGAVRDRFTVALQNGAPLGSERGGAYPLALALPAPSLLFVADLVIAGFDRMSSDSAAFFARLRLAAPALIIVLVLSAVLGVMAMRQSRSYGQSRRAQIIWGIAVLVLGLPAYVGFLLHRRWPVRLPCPNCHAQAPRDRPFCANCGAPFSGPPLVGIEVFA